VSRVLSLTMLAETLRMSVPYVCAALAGVVSERAGVVNIALEGLLLASAFGAVAAGLASGSAIAGLVAALVVGATLALVHAWLVVRARIDAIVSGIALNLLALAGTRFALRALYDSASNSPRFAAFQLGPRGASGFALLGRVVLDPVTLLAIGAVAFVPFLLASTRFGLRLRACGEHPAAAASAGVDVARVRIAAVALSGVLAALGGAHLAFDQHGFESGMSGGRGFIALAAVILGSWRPSRAVVACVAFAALDAMQIVLQDEARIPHELLQMLPYAATLVALASFVGKTRAPAGLGRDPDETSS
jgi:ABC-type uncharacterized transport system permease subunit